MAYFSRIEKPKIVLKTKEVPEQNKKIEPSEKQVMNRVTDSLS